MNKNESNHRDGGPPASAAPGAICVDGVVHTPCRRCPSFGPPANELPRCHPHPPPKPKPSDVAATAPRHPHALGAVPQPVVDVPVRPAAHPVTLEVSGRPGWGKGRGPGLWNKRRPATAAQCVTVVWPGGGQRHACCATGTEFRGLPLRTAWSDRKITQYTTMTMNGKEWQ